MPGDCTLFASEADRPLACVRARKIPLDRRRRPADNGAARRADSRRPDDNEAGMSERYGGA